MKRCLFFAAVMVVALMASAAMAAPSVYPTGTTIYDPAKAYSGYVLISNDFKDIYANVDTRELLKGKKWDFKTIAEPDDSEMVFLIDMNGNVVNTWKDDGSNKKCYLLPNGHMLSISQKQKAAIEYDWDGKVVWKYQTEIGPHHDGRRLENGNTIILCYEKVPESVNEKVVNVTTPWFGAQDRKSLKLVGDTIIEVTPDGKVVWEWKSSEHMIDQINNYLPIVNLTDWTHGNTTSIIPPNKWFDAGDKRFKPGNIMYNPRHFDEFVIIDKETKKVVWSFKFNLLGGLSQIHEPVMIPKGYPGEGNIIFFDNALFVRAGIHSGESAVWEINPSTNEPVWRYFPPMNGSNRFFSKYKGSAYKLPNGNVLISEDYAGRVFQVKPDMTHPDGGEIVWEWMSDTVVSRTSMYPYDFTPQLKALKKPDELKVSPLNPAEWKVLPDVQRKDGSMVKAAGAKAATPAPSQAAPKAEEGPGGLKAY